MFFGVVGDKFQRPQNGRKNTEKRRKRRVSSRPKKLEMTLEKLEIKGKFNLP